jgi:putative copper export protein
VLTADAYGALLLAKIAAFVILIIGTWLHRRKAAGDVLEGNRPFWQLVTFELLAMSLTLGLSVALSQTA